MHEGETTMTKYVFVYTGGTTPETEPDANAVMAAWGVWYEKMGAAVVDGGSPFTPAAKHVASNGSFNDGAVGVLATGYTIVNAESMDEALSHAKGCPVLDSGGQVTVYEAIDMGM